MCAAPDWNILSTANGERQATAMSPVPETKVLSTSPGLEPELMIANPTARMPVMTNGTTRAVAMSSPNFLPIFGEKASAIGRKNMER